MAKCSFCGKEMKKGTGKTVVQNSGRIFYYCSSKCEKNTTLGRKPRTTKWVEN